MPQPVDTRWRMLLHDLTDDGEPSVGTALLLAVPTWIMVRSLLPAALKSWRRSVQLLGPQRALGLTWQLIRIRHRQSFRVVKLTTPEFTLLPLLIAVKSLTTRWPGSLTDLRLYVSIERALLGIAWTTFATRPPVVLYLGSSEYVGFATLKACRVGGEVYAISLIDQASSNVVAHYHKHYTDVHMQMPAGPRRTIAEGLFRNRIFTDPTAPRDDSIRTRHRHWRRSVLELMDCVPIVVLDARSAGRQIQQEALWMLAPGRRHKLLFIVDEDDEHVVPPLMGELGRLGLCLTETGIRIRTTTESRVGEVIRAMTRSCTTLPRVTVHADAPAFDAALARAQERFTQLEHVYRDLRTRVRAGTEPDRALDTDLWRLTESASEMPYLTSSLDAALHFANDLLNRRAGRYSWRIDIMTDGTAVAEIGVQDQPGNSRVFESTDSESLSPPRAVLDALLTALLA